MQDGSIVTAADPFDHSHEPLVPAPALPPQWRNLATAVMFELGKRRGEELMRDAVPAPGAADEWLTTEDAFKKAAALAYFINQKIPAGEKTVGVLLLPTTTGSLVNLALVLLGKVIVNLDLKGIDDVAQQSGLKHIISVPDLLTALKIKVPDGVEVVDVREAPATVMQTGGLAWVGGALTAVATGSPEVARYFPGVLAGLDDVVAYQASTGSTGNRKLIMTTVRNVLAQAASAAQHFGLGSLQTVPVDPDLAPAKLVMGCMPFNHALGFTGTIWMPFLLGLKVLFHRNALEYGTVGDLCQQYGIEVFITSPSHWTAYLDKNCQELEAASAADRAGKVNKFAALRMVLLGSEPCPPALAWRTLDLLGFLPLECYGATELSPLATANTRRMVVGMDGRMVVGNRIGSVGQPIPGTAVQVRNITTGEVMTARLRADYYKPLRERPPTKEDPDFAQKMKRLEELRAELREEIAAKEGLLFWKGDQVMAGYLGRPDLTAQVLTNGWYGSGDVGVVDEDGFVYITGRLSRFAKIAGEMVPLVNVEQAIMAITNLTVRNVHVGSVFVGGIRGEKLVVLIYIDPEELESGAKTLPKPADIVAAMRAQGQPNLFIPKPKDFAFTQEPFKVAEGAGKVDLKDLKRRVTETFPAKE